MTAGACWCAWASDRAILSTMGPPREPLRVAIVGPCAAGKSTLAASLRSQGYLVRVIVQEHAFVPDLWRHFSRPDALIFLDASYAVCTARKRLTWLPQDHGEQMRRLDHARRHADIYIATDGLTREEVLAEALAALQTGTPSAV
jgi:hypothetical protein